MSRRTQLACAYSGYVWVGAFVLGWGFIAGFLPPDGPSETAAQVAARYADHTTSIRVGLLVCLGGAAFVLPWYAAIACQVKRLEGRHSPITYIQIAAGACLTMEFLFPLMFWANAAFRQGGSDELVQRLNDLAWLPFLGIVSTAMMSCFTLGFAVLGDQRADPIFPRWFAYLNFWAGLLFAPGVLIICFKTGPFAWNGILAFWTVFFAFAVWAIALTVLLVRAIRRQEPDSEDTLVERFAALDDQVAVLAREVQRLLTDR